jgi:hypothetical protein
VIGTYDSVGISESNFSLQNMHISRNEALIILHVEPGYGLGEPRIREKFPTERMFIPSTAGSQMLGSRQSAIQGASAVLHARGERK